MRGKKNHLNILLNTKAIDRKYKFAIMNKKKFGFTHNHSVTIADSKYKQHVNSNYSRLRVKTPCGRLKKKTKLQLQTAGKLSKLFSIQHRMESLR